MKNFRFPTETKSENCVSVFHTKIIMDNEKFISSVWCKPESECKLNSWFDSSVALGMWAGV